VFPTVSAISFSARPGSTLAKPLFCGAAIPMNCFCAIAADAFALSGASRDEISRASTTRLALQHGFRHYCGSDDIRRTTSRGQIIGSIIKHMRNAAL